MKLYWRKHHNPNYGYQKAIECKQLFNYRFSSNALVYVKKMMKHIDNCQIADKCIIDIWTGTDRYFRVEFRKDDKLIGHVSITPLKNIQDFEIYQVCFGSTDEFKVVIEEWEKAYKLRAYKKQLKKCGFDNDNSTIYSVNIDAFNDYKKIEEHTLKGTIKEIFDEYVTFNDRMRYINGTYWRWSENNVQQLFSMFINKFNGNYFLNNAVRRGCIID